ncbi:hypothetical protein ACDA63_17850 [Uliginosibacterium sp. sgz301328]|uniref:hypothetical protein n=1 Tax=Uliginosibacterium sp. sgz301328 TaxID=3243764 RepID=UPI00359DD611
MQPLRGQSVWMASAGSDDADAEDDDALCPSASGLDSAAGALDAELVDDDSDDDSAPCATLLALCLSAAVTRGVGPGAGCAVGFGVCLTAGGAGICSSLASIRSGGSGVSGKRQPGAIKATT